MTYAANLENEILPQQMLAVLSPKRIVSAFTLVSGSVYSAVFDYGIITEVTIDGVALTEGTTSSPASGEFYFDYANNLLYVGDNPTSSMVVATYELYLGTYDAHWYRVPTDSTTTEVYFEPLIKSAPTVSSSVSDVIFGYLPIQSANLTASNATQFFNRHLYDSTFKNCSIKIYHCVGDFNTSSIRLVMNAIGGDVSFTDSEISFSLLDRAEYLNNEFRHADGVSYFTESRFPDIDPNFINRPIREVIGFAQGVVPVNISYVADSPTTSDNREWVVKKSVGTEASVSTTVVTPISLSSTEVADASGIRVGDQLLVNSSQMIVVRSIVGNTLTHSTAVPGGVFLAGWTVTRGCISDVLIVQNGVQYRPILGAGRHWTETTFADGTIGITFDTTLEVGLGLPNTLSPSDTVLVSVYGQKNSLTKGGVSFGSNDATYGTMANAHMVLYYLLKHAGITESEIDLDAFDLSVTDALGFCVPASTTEDFPTYKTLVAQILQTTLCRFFQNNESKWSIVQTAPLGTASKSLASDEILKDSFSYQFDTSEIISDVFVEYGYQEIKESADLISDYYSRVTSTSDVARYLHNVSTQKTFKSLHLKSSEAQTFAERLAFIFGDRRGIIKLNTTKRFFDSLLGDSHTISRERMPGSEYVEGVEVEKSGSVLESKKGLSSVELIIDDQKGIEDNSSGW